jgi:hypothetical protein
MPLVAHIQRLSGRFLLPIYLEAEYWLRGGLAVRRAEERKICEGQVPVRWSKVYLRPLVAAVGLRIIPS